MSEEWGDVAELWQLHKAAGIEPAQLYARNFGGSVTFTPGDGTGLKEIARVHLKEPWLSRPWQLTWDITSRGVVDIGAGTPVLLPVIPTPSEAFVVIEFGSGAGRHQVECDLGGGGSFALSAQEVAILVDPGPDALAAALDPTPITVTASINPALGKKVQHVHRTKFVGELDAAATDSGIVSLPPFARTMELTMSDMTGGIQRIEALMQTPTGTANLGEWTYSSSGASRHAAPGNPLPIPNGTTEVQVTRVQGGTTTALVVFGIEV